MGVSGRAHYSFIEFAGTFMLLMELSRHELYFTQKSETPPNLRWCPVGPFTFLPIHAAGLYNTEMTETVSDYVVSSYVPTLSALITATPPSPQPNSFKMMVVI